MCQIPQKNKSGQNPDELQDLLDSSIPQKPEKDSEAPQKNADANFLEPYPVIKKKQTQKALSSQLKEQISAQYSPDAVNPMDTKIRNDFTHIVKFVDFNN